MCALCEIRYTNVKFALSWGHVMHTKSEETKAPLAPPGSDAYGQYMMLYVPGDLSTKKRREIKVSLPIFTLLTSIH